MFSELQMELSYLLNRIFIVVTVTEVTVDPVEK